jgi:uncharacterized integral membrane protein
MIFYYAVLGIAAILGLVVIIVSVQNGQSVPFNLFGGSVQMPLGVSLAGAWIAGLVGSAAVWQNKISQVRSEKTLEKWEVQDQKLLKEVASDQVKLLEAKIATLETALTKALEKKKKNS